MLAQEQVDSLFAFCRQHSVRYYDVQVELVDHFVNAIEEKLQQQPAQSFEQARDEVYKSFGFGGFNSIVKEKVKTLGRAHRRDMWTTFKSLFRMPLLIATLTVLLAEITAFRFLGRQVFLICLFSVTAFCFFVFVVRIIQVKKTQKESLLANDIMVSPSGNIIVLVIQGVAFAAQIFNMHTAIIKNNAGAYESVLWISFFNVYAILFILMLIVIHKREMELQVKYPLAFKEKTLLSRD